MSESVTDSLNCCEEDLIDVILAVEESFSKVIDIVAVVEFIAKENGCGKGRNPKKHLYFWALPTYPPIFW